MPAYRVEFIKEIAVDVMAESEEEARAAAMLTLDDIDVYWTPAEWALDAVFEASKVDKGNLHGIGRESTIVHIKDAVPASERDKFSCDHGVEVDLLGRGCDLCMMEGAGTDRLPLQED